MLRRCRCRSRRFPSRRGPRYLAHPSQGCTKSELGRIG
jgi:hypothetical protein